jgi:branched-chain amino acid transport system permease protein
VRLGLSAWRWRVPDEAGALRGPDGVDGFRDIRWLQAQGLTPDDFLWLAGAVLLAVLLAWAWLSRTRLGLATRALGHDETLAHASGLPVPALRTLVCAWAGALAGLAGGLYAHRLTFLDPAALDPMLGIHAVGYALIGGLATAAGPLLGAAFDLALLDATAQLASWRMVVFGGLVALFLRWRPRGLLDEALLSQLRALGLGLVRRISFFVPKH